MGVDYTFVLDVQYGCAFHCRVPIFDVIFQFSTLKFSSKTHLTVKPTSKLHIQYVSVIDPLSPQDGDTIQSRISHKMYFYTFFTPCRSQLYPEKCVIEIMLLVLKHLIAKCLFSGGILKKFTQTLPKSVFWFFGLLFWAIMGDFSTSL
jgi:hypothetical protein